MDALLIPTGSEPITRITLTDDHYPTMAAAIGGRCTFIERVRTRLSVPHLGNLVLAVDEMGLFHDWPRNDRASALYAPGVQPGIHGPALLMRESRDYLEGADFLSVVEGDLAVVTEYLSLVSR